jgi:hypothetical protein
MSQVVFPGEFDAGAKFLPADPARFLAVRRKLAGRKVEVVLRRPKSKRSIEMNKYLHCETGPFRLLAEHFGEDIPGVKLALMGECFGWVWSKAAGREVPIKGHSSEMTIEESKYFVDWVIPWAAMNHGVEIPLPNEVM